MLRFRQFGLQWRMISADNVWINALGVMPNGFGHKEMKTAAVSCLAGGNGFPVSIGQRYPRRTEDWGYNCSMGCR